MRIGIVLSASPGYSETFFNSKINGLKKQGHSVVLFCQKVSSDFSLCEVRKLPTATTKKAVVFNSIVTFFRLLPNFNSVLKYYKLERKDGVSPFKILKKLYLNAPFFKEKLDWLHFGFGTLALGRETIAETINARMAVSFRGFDIGVYPIKHKNCYAKLWSKADKIHVISDDIKDLLYANNFSNQAPVVKITPSIDVSFFSLDNKKANQTLQIITVARLHWKKGLDDTLKALSLLKEDDKAFHYTIIGSGPEEEYLKFLTSQLGLDARVSFKGKLEHAEIKEALEKSDIYLQYSVQEGFCNAVLEAQAMKLLCVVSDAEGLSENVLNNKSGWVVAKRKPELLKNKLKTIINLPLQEKETITRFASQRVADQFNIEKQQKAFVAFYSNTN